MGCPFCTVVDRESDGRCAGCGATDEQRAQAVLAAELDRALRARGGGRRRPAAAVAAAGGGRDWDALSEAVRKRYTGRGDHPGGLRERRRPRAGEGAPVMIAVCVLLLAAIVAARSRCSRCCVAHQFLAGVRGGGAGGCWRWPSCALAGVAGAGPAAEPGRG